MATSLAHASQRRGWPVALSHRQTAGEDEIRYATATMIEATRTLVEPAGALALAGALRMRDRLAGRKVVLRCTGGNISPAQLREVLRG
jgi:threonine dehydratase